MIDPANMNWLEWALILPVVALVWVLVGIIIFISYKLATEQ